MASLRFTKEQIKVYAENIKYWADDIINALEDDELNVVMDKANVIDREVDNIQCRLADCDEF